ncbi:DUF2927 domain-containing protein [Roseobacter sp. CCS2]|uniref:DUF2927 domain-containing protein n=1 Tax=Roseobacter sp. CCS2 TaxID=391593 RepID=UPI0009FF10FC|nr:DUF2927 domain-containing protein [Roseobacter sp. CCS2]
MPRIPRILTLLSFVFATLPAVVTAQEKPVYDQVVEILASERGTLRRWAYPPKLTVIHTGDPHRDQISRMVDMVHAQVPDFPGIGAVEFFDLTQFNRRLAGNTQFRMPIVDFDGIEGSIVRALFAGEEEEQDLSVTGSIFIFLTGLEDGITFGALTQSTKRLSRQFAEGGDMRCYFNVMSKNDELRAGFIFINMDDALTPVSECLYEEFMQTLGLLNDSQDSSLFTFDNTGITREDRDPDFQLLRALYSQDVTPGDKAQTAADIFMNMQTNMLVGVVAQP